MVLEPSEKEVPEEVPLVRRSRGSPSPIFSTIAEGIFQTPLSLEAVIYAAPSVAETTHAKEGVEARTPETSPVTSMIQEPEASGTSTPSFVNLQNPATAEAKANPFVLNSGQPVVRALDAGAKVLARLQAGCGDEGFGRT